MDDEKGFVRVKLKLHAAYIVCFRTGWPIGIHILRKSLILSSLIYFMLIFKHFTRFVIEEVRYIVYIKHEIINIRNLLILYLSVNLFVHTLLPVIRPRWLRLGLFWRIIPPFGCRRPTLARCLCLGIRPLRGHLISLLRRHFWIILPTFVVPRRWCHCGCWGCVGLDMASVAWFLRGHLRCLRFALCIAWFLAASWV